MANEYDEYHNPDQPRNPNDAATPRHGQAQGYGQPYDQQAPPYTPPDGRQMPQYGQYVPASDQYGQQQYGTAYGQNQGQGYGYGNPYGNPQGAPQGGYQYGQPYAGTGMPQAPAAPIPAYGTQPGAGDPNAEPPLWLPWYGISFPNAVKRFFTKYATFTGRASRGEYWWVILFTVLVAIVFSILNAATDSSALVTMLQSIWSLATLVPMLAVSVRRLHDTNRSGWWLLLVYVLEFVGLVILIVGGAVATFSLLSGTGDSLPVSGGAMMIGVLMVLVGVVMQIVLMAIGSNPEGARYDRPQQY